MERDARRIAGAGAHPRVLRVITRLNIGGPARHALLLAKAMPERGYPSHLVYGSVSAGEGEFTPPPGIEATYVRELRREIRPVDDLGALRRLGALVRAQRPDVVHTHLAKAGALGRVAARRAGVPVVVHTFHGHVLEGYFSGPASRAILVAERRLARSTDALVAVSATVRDELVALGIGPPERWRVIPLGLDLAPLLDRPVDPRSARRALGLPSDGPTVGIVGRLTPIKDHRTFLEAARRILRGRLHVTFVVAGDGELRPRLEELARPLGDRCRFVGWVTDLPTLYAALDVVVLTSRSEGTPVALIEASAAARPVVATRVGGVPDVVDDGATGLLAAAGDAEGVASQVERLLADASLRARLGRGGRERVGRRFSVERLADDLAALYGELLSAKRGTSTAP